MPSRKTLTIVGIVAAVAIALWLVFAFMSNAREQYLLRQFDLDPAEYTLKPPPKRHVVKRELVRIPILTADGGESGKGPALDDYPVASAGSSWSDALGAEAPPAGLYHVYYLTSGDPQDITIGIPQDADALERSQGRGKSHTPDEARPPLADFAELWRDEPNRLVAIEKVPAIDLHFSYNALHGIPSQDFAACWIGTLTIREAATYEFTPDLSWASARILLNRHRIFEGSNHKETVPVWLEPGEYALEVEYLNNWHTTNFAVHIKKTTPTP